MINFGSRNFYKQGKKIEKLKKRNMNKMYSALMYYVNVYHHVNEIASKQHSMSVSIC